MKCSISNIANVISESIPNPAESGFDIFVGLEHYDSGEVKVTRYGSTQNLVTAVKVFRKGDILLARRNVYLKRAGLVDFDGVTSGDSIVLRVKDDLSSLSLQSEDIRMYLPFVLNTEEFWNYAEKYSDGTMSKRLSPKTLLQYEFNIPDDVTEKNRLLWQAYKTKESDKAMITATDEMVKSQFIEMFGTISGNTPLSLGDFFSMKAGKSITAEDIKLDQEEDLYPCYGGNGVRGYVTSYTHEGDTVLIGRQGALCGNVQIARNKFYATEHAVVVTPKTPVNISWLYYALKSMELNQYARGVAQPGLAVGQLEKLPFVLPSMKSQNEFARVSHQADKSKFELKQAIEKIDKVMRALMQ